MSREKEEYKELVHNSTSFYFILYPPIFFAIFAINFLFVKWFGLSYTENPELLRCALFERVYVEFFFKSLRPHDPDNYRVLYSS